MAQLPSEDCDSSQFERVDVVPRKVHQYAVLVLIAVGFVAGNGVGAISLIVAAACMALGRYWRPFDPFRVLTVSLLQPSGLLPKRLAVEDRATRRIARVLGGTVFAASAVLVVSVPQLGWLPWTLSGAVGLMILLDAAFDFCALCFVFHRFGHLAGHLTRQKPAG